MIPNVHDPDYWHEELRPFLVDLDFALQLAVPKAHKFFSSYEEKPVNKPLLSNLIRYYVLEYLWSRGHNAKESDPDGWGMRSLSNNGIEVLYKRSCIRIRKGLEPPCPMTSSAQDFYQQSLFEECGEDSVVTNLLILWNLRYDLQYSGDMHIVRPVNGDAKTVVCDWSKRVVLGKASIDPECVVPSEYALPTELPLDPSIQSEDEDEDEDEEGTGTDGK
jgi:hypothetical protein